MQLQAGDMVDGRYLLQEEVGSGRLSSVYRAQDTADGNNTVAVKLLNAQHPDQIKREIFKRETAALKRLQHPNIIRLQRSGWSDEEGCFFLVLDWVPHSLDKYLKGSLTLKSDSFNPYRAMRELAGAVADSHSRNVIHRDIKPSNVLMDENGHLQLADFGISKLLDQLTTGETLAKYWSGGYASPEQQESKPAGRKSDIYSLGAVFYHILSKREPPPEGPTPDMVDEIFTPTRLRTVLKRMLARDPERREDGGRQLVESLETITRQIESLPTHRLLLTGNAVNDLRREGYVTDRDSAYDSVRENLGAASQGEVYVQQDPRGNGVRILGDSLRLICAPDNGILVVKAVHVPNMSELAKDRDHAMPYRAIWEPIHKLPEDLDGGNLDSLLAELAAHQKKNVADQKQRRSRRKFIQLWLDVLNSKKRDIEGQGLEYEKARKRGGGLEFILSKPAPDNLGWTEDSPLVVEVPDKKRRYESVGNLIEVQGKLVYVTGLDRRKSKDDIPQTGKLMLDQVQASTSIRRQIAAAYDFLGGDMVNPKMADVVADPSKATRMPEPILDFYQDWLSEDKKSAVRKAVASNELFLIRGPPGTGKTAVIAEIVLQVLKRKPDARILLSSQSNVAVDHAMAQIGKVSESDLPMVRLGRPEKIGSGGRNWSIEQQASNLHREVRDKCSAVIDKLKRQEKEYQRAINDQPAQAAPAPDDGRDSSDPSAKLDQTRKTCTVLKGWTEVAGIAPDFEKLIVEQSNVVGATCLFSGGRRMPEADFDLTIIDEAGRATPPEALVPMAKAERTILVGDERQLPPMIDDLKPDGLRQASSDDRLDESLFQSLAEDSNSSHTTTLSTQYRMHPAIGRLISEAFYDGKIKQGTKDSRQGGGWMRKPVTWLSTSSLPNHSEGRKDQSFINRAEADLILRKLKDLENCQQPDRQPTVGVISGYSAQVALLQSVVRPNDSGRWRRLRIEIATVDSFQGRECDVIIYSTVRSNRNRRIGFLKDYRRLNVALSRARDLLVIVGDDVVMRNAITGQDNPFTAVLKHIRENKEECDLVKAPAERPRE